MFVEGGSGDGGVASASASPPPPHPPVALFKPSVIVMVGIFTMIFSITFLLLLYVKHYKSTTNGYSGSLDAPRTTTCKNFSVNHVVVESLPVFCFGSLRGPKDGLECVICLSRFVPSEILRMLQKCKRAFHVECVNTWLDANSTCPLCHYRVDPEDILLVQELSTPLPNHQSLPAPGIPAEDSNVRTQRVSGHHSSSGEQCSSNNNNNNKLLQIILQSSSRRSLDSCTKPAKTPIQNKMNKISSSSSITVGIIAIL